MCSVHSLITTFLFQGCFLGAAPGSGEGKLNTHSKNRGGDGEPPVAWLQCVLQLAFTFWLPPPITSQLTLFYALSFWLFFIYFSLCVSSWNWVFRLFLFISLGHSVSHGKMGSYKTLTFSPTFFPRTHLSLMPSTLPRSRSLFSCNLIMCLFGAVSIHP